MKAKAVPAFQAIHLHPGLITDNSVHQEQLLSWICHLISATNVMPHTTWKCSYV